MAPTAKELRIAEALHVLVDEIYSPNARNNCRPAESNRDCSGRFYRSSIRQNTKRKPLGP